MTAHNHTEETTGADRLEYAPAWWAIGAGLAMILAAVLLWPNAREAAEEPRPPAAGPHRPNLALIVIDALRADRIGARRNGQVVMPFLESLRAAGTVYQNVWSSCSWTRPSMSSLFTSLPMETHQVRWSADPDKPDSPSDVLSDAFETWAEYLREFGWHTIGVQTNPNCLPQFGLAQGFENYAFSAEWRADQVTGKALELIGGSERPFFLYAHYMEPHLPYPSSEDARAALGWSPEGIPASDLDTAQQDFKTYFWAYLRYRYGMTSSPPPDFSNARREAVRLLYDAACLTVDRAVQRLVETVSRQFPDTLFIILADHGEQFWDHELLGHGLSLFEEETRVPLILYGWNTPAGILESAPVSLLDVLPLTAFRMGLPARQHWMGTVPQLPDRPVFSATRAPWPSWNTDLDMVVFGPWKLIRDNNTRETALYDLRADPGEKSNRSAECEAIVRQGLDLLGKHVEEAIARRQAGREIRLLDDAVKEQLKAIGYLE